MYLSGGVFQKALRIMGIRSFSAIMCVGVVSGLIAADAKAQLPRHLQLLPPDRVAATRFTRVIAVRELSDGSVIVADRTENRLVHVNWHGGEATEIGRRGEGPGEFRTVGWLYPLSGDSSLFTDSYSYRWLVLVGARIVDTISQVRSINQMLGANLLGTDRSGHVLGVRGYKFAGVSRVTGSADSLLLLLGEWASGAIDTIARIKGPGSAGYKIARGSGAMMMIGGNPLRSADQALLFADGWIGVARAAPYRIDWRLPNGRWINGRPLPFTRVPVNTREKCFALKRYFSSRRTCDPSFIEGWPELVPPFVTSLVPVLFATPSGELVVTRTPRAGLPTNHYDIVGRDGRLMGTMNLPENQTVIGFGAKSVYTLHTDDLGLQTLQRHSWVR